MVTGDLVIFNDVPDSLEKRILGVIIRFDIYRGDGGNGTATPIAEVLWSEGPGWIASSRIEVFSENQ